jgi:septal ring factor EnvC (AmiA/AmiB activator)
MIVIYFFFDNSFPILPIIVIVFGIYLVNNDLPIGKIMTIVLCVYLLYHALRVITFVISGRCGQHRPALMLERFTSNNYSSLRGRLKSLDSKIAKSSNKVDSIRSDIEGLRPNICAILRQIDESVEGDYNSNIPEEEYKLPAEKQQQRVAERAKKAKLAISERKAIYVKNNNNIPILECFDDTLAEEIDSEKDAINADISLTEDSLNSLVSEFSEVKGLLGGHKNNSYASTLNYNDRYIKKMWMIVDGVGSVQ